MSTQAEAAKWDHSGKGWIRMRERVWRGAILVLLVIAILGPWWFDQINVPAKYACGAPFVRLEGDFCGMPMTGLWFPWMLVSQIYQLVSGGYVPSNMGSAILAVTGASLLEAAVLLPIFSTLYALVRGGRRRFPALYIVMWVLAVIAVVYYVVDLIGSPGVWALWGIWLYLGAAVLGLALEVVRRRGEGGEAAG